jgi:hypothetical protein
MERVALRVTLAAKAAEKLPDGLIRQVAAWNASRRGSGIEFFAGPHHFGSNPTSHDLGPGPVLGRVPFGAWGSCVISWL